MNSNICAYPETLITTIKIMNMSITTPFPQANVLLLPGHPSLSPCPSHPFPLPKTLIFFLTVEIILHS